MLNIAAEDINKYVADAIINSAIGKQLEEAIKRSLVDLNKTWDNPYEKLIKEEIKNQAAIIIKESFTPTIKESIREKVTSLLTDEYISELLNTIRFGKQY